MRSGSAHPGCLRLGVQAPAEAPLLTVSAGWFIGLKSLAKDQRYCMVLVFFLMRLLIQNLGICQPGHLCAAAAFGLQVQSKGARSRVEQAISFRGSFKLENNGGVRAVICFLTRDQKAWAERQGSLQVPRAI